MDADVIIVGAGPTGLMLASELCLAGVRPLVLERQPQLREAPKANGFNGQIVELVRYRGLLGRVEAASGRPIGPAPAAPFGGVHLDFSQLADPPIWAVHLPQPRLERLLDEHARELGADIRRGHAVAGVSQDDATVTADVRGPDGPGQVTARYLVGCDGAHSRVRDTAGIPFPGTTYPEVNRLAQVTVPDSVTRLDNGDLDVPGLGRIRAGFTRTDRGVFGFGSLTSGVLLLQTTEDEPAGVDDDVPMTLTEFQDSIRRVLGGGSAPGRRDAAVALRVGGPAGRAVPRRADPAGRRCGPSVSRHGHRHQFRHARRGQPGLEAGRRHRGLGAGRPAGHLSRRAPLRGGTCPAPDPGPGGTAARSGPGRASAPGALPRAGRRRAAIAPPGRAYRRRRHPLPDAWPRHTP